MTARELKKRSSNRKRTLNKDLLCPCLITYARSYSRYLSVIPINEQRQCTIHKTRTTTKIKETFMQRSLSIPISHSITHGPHTLFLYLDGWKACRYYRSIYVYIYIYNKASSLFSKSYKLGIRSHWCVAMKI